MSGFSLDVDEKIELPPKTVGEILYIGEEEYSQRIGLLSISKEMIAQDKSKSDEMGDISSFSIITQNCYYSIETRKQILGYLRFFFNDNVEFLEDMMCFYIGELEDDKLLTQDNYEEFLNCMKIQNKIDNSKAKRKPKKLSPKAQRLLDKRNRGRAQLAKARGQDNVKLSDLLLNLATFLNGDFERCSRLTLYQFYELYQKMLRKDRFDQNFDIYVAGGDPKKLDLDNHWTAKEIEKKQEAPQSI